MDYDGLNRLTWTDAPGLLTTALYAYDALDNLRWVNYSGYGREPQQHRYDVDANNRHWRYFITNGTASITRTYTHDARGNRLGSTTPGPAFGTRNYTYDRTNRMTSSNDGATWEYYWYDGHGRRTVINRPGGNTVQIYSRDGRLVYERAPGGSTTKHIYLAGRLVGSMTGSTTTYLHTDTLGTVVRRTNAAGLELGPRQTWEPYGSLSNGQYLQAPGFTGHVSDVHSGLIYMQQRHYDPVAMRFMSVDPVHVDTSSGGNFNRYWYANNNPYRFVDPDGRQAVDDYGRPRSTCPGCTLMRMEDGRRAFVAQAVAADVYLSRQARTSMHEYTTPPTRVGMAAAAADAQLALGGAATLASGMGLKKPAAALWLGSVGAGLTSFVLDPSMSKLKSLFFSGSVKAIGQVSETAEHTISVYGFMAEATERLDQRDFGEIPVYRVDGRTDQNALNRK